MFLFGVLAALASPLMMTIGFIIWDHRWKGSSFALNLYKCTLASLMFLVTLFIFRGVSMAKYFSPEAAMLVLSSLLGIVIGDNTWLYALQLLGARNVIIIDSTKPFMGAVLGAAILGEKLSALSICGMFLTCAGVLVVALDEASEHSDNGVSDSDLDSDNQEEQIMFNNPLSREEDDGIESISLEAEDMLTTLKGMISSPMVVTRRGMVGYSFALINVILDAYGSILTKQHGSAFSTWEINLIRFGFAAVSMGFIALSVMVYSTASNMSGNKRHNSSGGFEMIDTNSEGDGSSVADTVVVTSSHKLGHNADRCRRDIDRGRWYLMPWTQTTVGGWGLVSLGVCFVTYICPALANYAIFQMNVGLCLTLTSLGPLYSLPLVWFMKGERTSSLGILGTFVAFVGVVMLCYSEGNRVQTPEVLWADDEGQTVPLLNMTANSHLPWRII